MAQKKRFRRERAPKMLRFFFWEDKLHRTLYIDPPLNTVRAWCYDDEKEVQFVYSHIRVHRERAWRTSEVCKLVNRTKRTILKYVHEGGIRPPTLAPSMNGDEKYVGIGFWRAKDIYDLHDYMLQRPEVPGRRSRSDYRVPSRMELTARMEEGVSYTIVDSEGNKTRAFRETLW